MSKPKNSLLSTFIVALLTFVSRISGMAREMVKAYFLGTGPAADAFNLAFTIPNLFRRFTAEGTMLTTFIPFLTEASQKNVNGASARTFVASFAVKLLLFLALLSGLFVAFAPFWIENVFAPGFDAERAELSATLLRVMFAYILLISTAALLQGVLNHHGSFALASFTPILLNLSVIGSAFLLSDALGGAEYAMSAGVLLGGALQMLVLYPGFRKLGYKLTAGFRWRDETASSALRCMVPGLFGAGVYQLNVIAGNFIASGLETGAISALIYSNRLVELILGVFVVSLVTVNFPALSQQISSGDAKGAANGTLQSLGIVSFMTVPAIFALMALSGEVVRLLFERGSFDARSTELTVEALLYQAPGMLFIGLNRVLISVFNASKKFKLLFYISAAVTVANVLLSFWLADKLGVGGIALASTVSQAMQTWILFDVLKRRRLMSLEIFAYLGRLAKHCSAGGIAFGAMLAANSLLDSSSFWGAVLTVAGCGLAGGLSYLAAGAIFRVDELKVLPHMLRRKKKSSKE